MDELISRQAAIDALTEDEYREFWDCIDSSVAADIIRRLPPAEPKRGKWIKLDMHRGIADHKCTACKQECYVPTCMGEPMYAFCPHCGAKMEVNHESN